MQIENITYSKQALHMFHSEIETYGVVETGGVMLGYVNGKIVHVEKVSNGGLKAFHEYLYFRADNNYIEMFIDIEVANSGGKLRYLGEWHTHPQIKPEPSEIDLNSLYEIAEASNDFCLLLIIGAVDFEIGSFLKQSISIINHKMEKKFYVLPSNVNKCC